MNSPEAIAKALKPYKKAISIPNAPSSMLQNSCNAERFVNTSAACISEHTLFTSGLVVCSVIAFVYDSTHYMAHVAPMDIISGLIVKSIEKNFALSKLQASDELKIYMWSGKNKFACVSQKLVLESLEALKLIGKLVYVGNLDFEESIHISDGEFSQGIDPQRKQDGDSQSEQNTQLKS